MMSNIRKTIENGKKYEELERLVLGGFFKTNNVTELCRKVGVKTQTGRGWVVCNGQLLAIFKHQTGSNSSLKWLSKTELEAYHATMKGLTNNEN